MRCLSGNCWCPPSGTVGQRFPSRHHKRDHEERLKMSNQPTTSYTVAHYIIDRLAALGVRHVFNVPGNYSAQFLMTAQASGKLVCVGTTNEMEAGYAADAQARLNGIGV